MPFNIPEVTTTFPPRILILGGCSFLGRWLVTLLVESIPPDEWHHMDICVLDRDIPQMSPLTRRHKAAFEKIRFLQCNVRISGNSTAVNL
jgi:nucleoside-diphosphate-sugar epimerase